MGFPVTVSTEDTNQMFRYQNPVIVGLLGLALLSGCAGFMANDRRESNAEVILVSFGSTNGEIAPCG